MTAARKVWNRLPSRKAVSRLLRSTPWSFLGCAKLALAFISAGTLLFGVLVPSSQAQEQPQASIEPDQFYRARVVEIVRDEAEESFQFPGASAFNQVLKAELESGERAGRTIELNYGGVKNQERLNVGDGIVVVSPGGTQDTEQFFIFDRYRLTPLLWIIGFFFFVIIAFARWRGVTSLIGLGVSVLVLTMYVVPQILAGANALVVTLLGSLVIAVVSIYLAHGFSRRTTVAVGSTLITICIALGFSVVFVFLAKLLGVGSEEAFYLQMAPVQNINLRGLLLGGIIVGALGVLDDITTAQAAAVDEIAKANPRLSRRELFQRGMSVGKEHITSLVNTLVLAYAGASFPALLLFTINARPAWVVLNTETIAEEIVRTLVGSIALICAVPITCALAAYFLRNQQVH